MSEYAIGELTESCVEMFPSLSSLAWPRARALTGRGVSRALTACGSTLRELTLAGCASLTEEDVKTALDLARGLRALDVTGCWGVKRLVVAAVDAPRLETLKAVNCTSVTTLSIRRAAGSNALKTVNAAECAALREFQVQSESVKTLNAAGCRTLETFKRVRAEVRDARAQQVRDVARRDDGDEHRAHEYIWRARVDARRV